MQNHTSHFHTQDFNITDEFSLPKNSDSLYIIVPLTSILIVILLLAFVYYMARRRRLEQLRHQLMPLYNFDRTSQDTNPEEELLYNVYNPNYNYMDYNMTSFISRRN